MLAWNITQPAVEKTTHLKIARNWWLVEMTVEPFVGANMLQANDWPIRYGITLLNICSWGSMDYLYHLWKKQD
jgi:hypothetical protein